MKRRIFLETGSAAILGLCLPKIGKGAQVENGEVKPPNLPGLGLKFKKDLFERDDVIVETIAEE